MVKVFMLLVTVRVAGGDGLYETQPTSNYTILLHYTILGQDRVDRRQSVYLFARTENRAFLLKFLIRFMIRAISIKSRLQQVGYQ